MTNDGVGERWSKSKNPGQWRIVCGLGNIPEGMGQYPIKQSAYDVLRLHSIACKGTHSVEFVPD